MQTEIYFTNLLLNLADLKMPVAIVTGGNKGIGLGGVRKIKCSLISAQRHNTPPNSGTKYLYPAHSWNCHGRSFAFWLHFHSVIFRSQLYLVISDLLHVWISIFGICHSYHYLLGDNNIALLFPPMCRGKFYTTF